MSAAHPVFGEPFCPKSSHSCQAMLLSGGYGRAQGPCVSTSLPNALFLNQSITLAVLLSIVFALSRENY